MKKLMSSILFLSTVFFAFSQDAKKTKQIVPISIIVAADQASAGSVDIPLYTDQILTELNKSQNANFVLVDPDKDPEVMIDITVANLNIGQRIQRSNNTTVPTFRVVGTDANGRSITQQGVLIREELVVERNSSARFSTKLTTKENASLADRTFNSVFNFSQITSSTPGYSSLSIKAPLTPKQLPEPKTEEYLLLLSKKDLTGYLAGELRKFYSNKGQIARVN